MGSWPRTAAGLALVALALAAAACGSSSAPGKTTLGPSVMKPLRRAARADIAYRRTQRASGKVTVPRLVGRRFDAAIRAVRRAGLRQREPGFSGSTGNPHESGGVDRIVSQSPQPGTKVPRGSTIVIEEGVQSKLGGGRYAPPPGEGG